MLRALLITALLACTPLLPAQEPPLSCDDAKLEEALADLKKEARENGGSPRAARQVYLRYDYAGHREQALAWADVFIRLLEEKAAQGNPRAMTNLAHIFMQGDTVVPANREKAVKWLQAAEQKEMPGACVILGSIHAADGRMEEAHKSFSHAYAIYEKRAAEGDEDAMLKQADMLFRGMGAKQDPDRAVAIYKQLAEKDNATALMELYRIYSANAKSDKGMRIAMGYAARLADKGDTRMAYLVSCELKRGKYLDKDEQAAAKYLQAAIKEPRPFPEALYQMGWDTEQAGNSAAAIPYYERAILLNHDRAPVRLGAILLNGAQGEEGRARGLKLLEDTATRLRSPFAAYELALHRMRAGEPDQADTWYIKASEYGYAPAMARRGMLHLNPFSAVEWSPTLAYRWWKQGARAGDPACSRCINLYLYLFIPLLVILTFSAPLLLRRILRKRAARR